MKRNRRRLPIPQHEFGFVPGTFGLITESTLDGERLARESDEVEKARRLAEAAPSSKSLGVKASKSAAISSIRRIAPFLPNETVHLPRRLVRR